MKISESIQTIQGKYPFISSIFPISFASPPSSPPSPTPRCEKQNELPLKMKKQDKEGRGIRTNHCIEQPLYTIIDVFLVVTMFRTLISNTNKQREINLHLHTRSFLLSLYDSFSSSPKPTKKIPQENSRLVPIMNMKEKRVTRSLRYFYSQSWLTINESPLVNILFKLF